MVSADTGVPTLREGLGSIVDTPLTDADIRQILGKDIRILTYPELNNLTSIEDAFDRKGRCILLYLTQSDTSGHWVCMLNKKDTIEFFDPYGEPPEYALKEIGTRARKALNGNRFVLTDLLKSSGKKVIYNTYPFQKDKKNVNTCGRHSVVRCLYAPYSLEKYKKVMDKSGMTPDNFVSALTAPKIGK